MPKDPKDPELPPTLAIPWIAALRAALNHGGTRRPKRDRREAKRKQLQLATGEVPSDGGHGEWSVGRGPTVSTERLKVTLKCALLSHS